MTLRAAAVRNHSIQSIRNFLTCFSAVNFDRNGRMGWVTWAGLMIDYLVKIDKMPFKLPF